MSSPVAALLACRAFRSLANCINKTRLLRIIDRSDKPRRGAGCLRNPSAEETRLSIHSLFIHSTVPPAELLEPHRNRSDSNYSSYSAPEETGESQRRSFESCLPGHELRPRNRRTISLSTGSGGSRHGSTDRPPRRDLGDNYSPE